MSKDWKEMREDFIRERVVYVYPEKRRGIIDKLFIKIYGRIKGNNLSTRKEVEER